MLWYMEGNKYQGWRGVEYLTPNIVHILVCSMCLWLLWYHAISPLILIGSATCFQRSVKISSSLPIMVACINASKISCFMSLPFPKFSLLSQNAGGNLDARDSMYIVLVILKTSSLTFYNYLSSAFCFSFIISLLNYASLSLALSLN